MAILTNGAGVFAHFEPKIFDKLLATKRHRVVRLSKSGIETPIPRTIHHFISVTHCRSIFIAASSTRFVASCGIWPGSRGSWQAVATQLCYFTTGLQLCPFMRNRNIHVSRMGKLHVRKNTYICAAIKR